jgi:hypothetical protein
MGAHSVYRGDESTYAANGGKQNPIHVGKHRAKPAKLKSTPDNHYESLGTHKDANPKYTQESD